MKRIMVVGNIGAGKSTFAKALHDLTHIEIYHLDKFFFKTKRDITPHDEWVEFATILSQKETWIIDGNYPNTLLIRAERADTIFLLDPPIIICYFNVIKRSITNILFKKQRSDSPLFKYDSFTCSMFRRIWRFKSKRKKYYSTIFAMQKDIYHFKSMKESRQFIIKYRQKINGTK